MTEYSTFIIIRMTTGRFRPGTAGMIERRRWMAGDSLRGNGREDGCPITNVGNDLVEEDGCPITNVGHNDSRLTSHASRVFTFKNAFPPHPSHTPLPKRYGAQPGLPKRGEGDLGLPRQGKRLIRLTMNQSLPKSHNHNFHIQP